MTHFVRFGVAAACIGATVDFAYCGPVGLALFFGFLVFVALAAWLADLP